MFAARRRPPRTRWTRPSTALERAPPRQHGGHWLPGFNFNVEEWFEGDRYEMLAICRSLELASGTRRETGEIWPATALARRRKSSVDQTLL
jgi:hypothetical protein